MSAKGRMELAVEHDVARLPKDLQHSAMAAACRLVARRIDAGLSAPDMITACRELRIGMARLAEQSPPGEGESHVGDELRDRRRQREAG